MPPTPEIIARVRQLYADGAAIARIEAETGVDRWTLYRCIGGGPFTGGLPPLPRRRAKSGVGKSAVGKSVVSEPLISRPPSRKRRGAKTSGAAPAPDRVALVGRLWRTADRQVREIEQRLEAEGQEPADRERDARMLAVLVKTLRELTALDAAATPPDQAPEEDDPVPRDLDELRRELARRMDAFVAGRTGA